MLAGAFLAACSGANTTTALPPTAPKHSEPPGLATGNVTVQYTPVIKPRSKSREPQFVDGSGYMLSVNGNGITTSIPVSPSVNGAQQISFPFYASTSGATISITETDVAGHALASGSSTFYNAPGTAANLALQLNMVAGGFVFYSPPGTSSPAYFNILLSGNKSVYALDYGGYPDGTTANGATGNMTPSCYANLGVIPADAIGNISSLGNQGYLGSVFGVEPTVRFSGAGDFTPGPNGTINLLVSSGALPNPLTVTVSSVDATGSTTTYSVSFSTVGGC